MADTIVPFGLHIDAHRDLRAQILTGPVGSVHVTKVSAPPMTAYRTARLIRVSDPELFKIDVQLLGHTVFAQGDREAALASGDFTLMDLSRPCRLAGLEDEHEVLAVKFPHAALPLRHHEVRARGLQRPDDRVGARRSPPSCCSCCCAGQRGAQSPTRAAAPAGRRCWAYSR